MVATIAAETVHTHKREGDDHAFELCQCNCCGVVRRCTPTSDFLVRIEDMEDLTLDGAPYYCEPCFLDVISPAVV
jgi:uncharacterized protein (DUF779 family)